MSLEIQLLQLQASISDLVIPIISVIVIVGVALMARTYSKKQYERTALTDVFDMLGSKENKDAEKLLIDSKGNMYEDDHIPEYYLNAIRIVKRNYFKLGLMIDYELIPSYSFYITFGHKLVQLYDICQKEIEKTRNNHVSHHGAYFTNLAIDCLNFYLDTDEMKPVKNLLNEEISRGKFGIKINIPKEKKWKLF